MRVFLYIFVSLLLLGLPTVCACSPYCPTFFCTPCLCAFSFSSVSSADRWRGHAGKCGYCGQNTRVLRGSRKWRIGRWRNDRAHVLDWPNQIDAPPSKWRRFHGRSRNKSFLWRPPWTPPFTSKERDETDSPNLNCLAVFCSCCCCSWYCYWCWCSSSPRALLLLPTAWTMNFTSTAGNVVEFDAVFSAGNRFAGPISGRFGPPGGPRHSSGRDGDGTSTSGGCNGRRDGTCPTLAGWRGRIARWISCLCCAAVRAKRSVAFQWQRNG